MNIYNEETILTFSKVMRSSEVPREFDAQVLPLCTIRNNKPYIKHESYLFAITYDNSGNNLGHKFLSMHRNEVK